MHLNQTLRKEVKHGGSLVMTVAKRFSADKCTSLAASIAFYSAFSLAPTLLMVVSVAGWFFGAEAARGQLFSRINGFLGNDAAAAIQSIVEHAHQGGGSGIAALISVVLLIVGASATFSSLNTALDVVFPIAEAERRSGIALMVRVRLISFSLVLGIAFLLVVSLVLDTAVTFAGKMLWGNSPWLIIGDIVQMVLSLVILSAAFGALLKMLPDARVPWRDAGFGGLIAALLFTLGKKLFALYLAHAGTASAFGAAGSLAVLLMWLYFSAVVLLLGAEFAAARAGFAPNLDPSVNPAMPDPRNQRQAPASAPGRAGAGPTNGSMQGTASAAMNSVRNTALGVAHQAAHLAGGVASDIARPRGASSQAAPTDASTASAQLAPTLDPNSVPPLDPTRQPTRRARRGYRAPGVPLALDRDVVPNVAAPIVSSRIVSLWPRRAPTRALPRIVKVLSVAAQLLGQALEMKRQRDRERARLARDAGRGKASGTARGAGAAAPVVAARSRTRTSAPLLGVTLLATTAFALARVVDAHKRRR